MHVTVVHALKKPDPCTALLMFDCFHLELLVLLLTNYIKLIKYICIDPDGVEDYIQ